jgi:hypothetical protein
MWRFDLRIIVMIFHNDNRKTTERGEPCKATHVGISESTRNSSRKVLEQTGQSMKVTRWERQTQGSVPVASDKSEISIAILLGLQRQL